ncbi:MAG: reverse transcriptase domain-containing protein, partial [Rikenellaceae bacterium]
LTKIYDPTFSNWSFGFRPRRGCHDALRRVQRHVDLGYKYAVDLDLEKFFDKVNHSKLIRLLSERIKDSRLISLIHKYLNAGVIVSGKFERTTEGVPQGGNLSPILSNIMLNELDKELANRGHKFVRYADDCMILCKSQRSAQRMQESITKFIEQKLSLRVNREKTRVGYVRGWNLREYIQGWITYYHLADMKQHLRDVDKWLRRRIRMCIWKCWKKPKAKFKNLQRCGIDKQKSLEWANTRKGYWRIAKSPILQRAITYDSLCQAGYIFLSDCYSKYYRN